jgi:hypothetical protein
MLRNEQAVAFVLLQIDAPWRPSKRDASGLIEGPYIQDSPARNMRHFEVRTFVGVPLGRILMTCSTLFPARGNAELT